MKHLKFIVLSSVIIFSLALPANAHPGRTDSNGGHYDHSTGEYHYHHGYPAHDHYDMDGDGDLDCPYDFDDQTGRNSGSSYSGEENSHGNPYASHDKEVTGSNNRNVHGSLDGSQDIQENGVSGDMFETMLPVFLIAGIVLFFGFHSAAKRVKEVDALSIEKNAALSQVEALKEENRRLSSERSQLRQEINAQASQLRQLQSDYDRVVGENTALQSSYNRVVQKNDALRKELLRLHQALPSEKTVFGELPNDVYFINGNVPVKGRISDRKPFGEFTAYIAQKGRCYHSDSYCGSGYLRPIHVFRTHGEKIPCSKCCDMLPDGIPDWYIRNRHLFSLE